MDTCCTCARLSAPREKPLSDRRLGCCGRLICGGCIHDNTRFASYCPFCQVSEGPSILPQRLREPPSYTSVATTADTSILASRDTPPPYRGRRSPPPDYEKVGADDSEEEKNTVQDYSPPALHFLDHERDSVASLSLRYGVPAPVLRRANRLHSDHLLAARRTVVIPGDGRVVSLSPRPPGGEEEEARKGRIRRWMVATKVADYDVAVLYLEQAAHDLEAAVQAYRADEAWEREHPWGGRRRRW